MPADLYLQLLPPTAGITAPINGAPVDLCKGSDAQKYNSNAPNLLAGKDTRLLRIRVDVANAGGTAPSMQVAYQESDGDQNPVPASGTFTDSTSVLIITGNGEYFLLFNPRKRWGRLVVRAITGAGATFDAHAEVCVAQSYA